MHLELVTIFSTINPVCVHTHNNNNNNNNNNKNIEAGHFVITKNELFWKWINKVDNWSSFIATIIIQPQYLFG